MINAVGKQKPDSKVHREWDIGAGSHFKTGCYNKVKMSCYWIKMGPNPITGALIRKGDLAMTHTHTEGRWPREDGDRVWSDVSISPRMPTVACIHQKLEEA